MRQFFNSAVSLFRGQLTALDYNKHAHARYLVCQLADSLAFGTFQPKRWEIPLEEIDSLYSQDGREKLPSCLHHPILEVGTACSPYPSWMTCRQIYESEALLLMLEYCKCKMVDAKKTSSTLGCVIQ